MYCNVVFVMYVSKTLLKKCVVMLYVPNCM
jgi:hypothetical protein